MRISSKEPPIMETLILSYNNYCFDRSRSFKDVPNGLFPRNSSFSNLTSVSVDFGLQAVAKLDRLVALCPHALWTNPERINSSCEPSSRVKHLMQGNYCVIARGAVTKELHVSNTRQGPRLEAVKKTRESYSEKQATRI